MNKNTSFVKNEPPNFKRCKTNQSPIEISDDEANPSYEKVKKTLIFDEGSVPLYLNQSKYEKFCPRKLEFKSFFNVYSKDHPKNIVWTIKDLLIASYVIEIDWIVNELKSQVGENLLENLLFISHNEGKQNCTVYPKVDCFISRNISEYFPKVKIPFGVFHSKFMLIHFENLSDNSKSFMRFVITSANFIESDWNQKSQSIWVQDFPKENKKQENKCEFKSYLIEFVESIISTATLRKTWIGIIDKFDFTHATAELIGSVPGYFNDQKEKFKWGHLRVKSLLDEIEKKKVNKAKEDNRGKLLMQFSSIGRISKNWLFEEFSSSLVKSIKEPPQIVFPTVEQVINSYEGIIGGASLPAKKMYIDKPWIRNLLYRWGNVDFNNPLNRLIPHIKTFLNYTVDNDNVPKITWIIQGSHNLSNAAWGKSQKETRFCIRNYELSVLIHKDKFDHLSLCGVFKDGFEYPRFTWCSRNDINSDSTEDKPEFILKISLPFSLPPKPYSIEDCPWNIELLIDS
ncbi:hypothetical protein FG386_003646 [Cryptosporidium ryanae]|uniref:uncharacterized protein n=1 Tax=Cryptosporidium ryanae TaxID=515981 RepID=UPI00351A0303|nr:hypothetical protein FG386_003646 [Cryptosporidium ryanae]